MHRQSKLPPCLALLPGKFNTCVVSVFFNIMTHGRTRNTGQQTQGINDKELRPNVNFWSRFSSRLLLTLLHYFLSALSFHPNITSLHICR